jgi:hypothetical protein
MAEVDPRVTFFPQRKIRVQLEDWGRKKNSEDEKRLRLDFVIPLVDEARDGVIPGWIIDPLNAMENPASKQKDAHFDTVLDSVTLEFWDTPTSPKRTLLLTAATLNAFSLKRTEIDGRTYWALHFSVNYIRHVCLNWADKYEDCWVWMEATISGAADVPSKPVPGEQMTIADAGATEPDDEGEHESEAEEVAEQSEQNIREFFAKDDSDQEQSSDERNKSDAPSDGIPQQSADAAAAVAEIPAGHEECSNCHSAFPRAQEPANWIEGKVRKATKAPLAVRKQLGTSFGYICGACVNTLTPKVAEQEATNGQEATDNGQEAAAGLVN